MTSLGEVLTHLGAPKLSIRDSLPALPPKAGLYAIYGGDEAWAELGLGRPVENLPLYVGKAADSLSERDLKDHFGNGRTGRSTVRRSFAALLREDLDLAAMPRNPAEPADFDRYALSTADDQKLTDWMRGRLEIAVWTWDQSRPLDDIEHDVLARLNPPINIVGVSHRWRIHLKARRAEMASEAKYWSNINPPQ